MKTIRANLGAVLLAALISGGPALAGWTNITQDLGGEHWGYAGVCLVVPVPQTAAMIAGVSEAGLWRSDDLGGSWRKLDPQNPEPIRHRPHQVVFDPQNAEQFWVSGCYGASPQVTRDGGRTFQRLGNLTHMDGIAIDFTDPQRQTIVVGLHEQARSAHRSADGGKTWQKIGDALPADSNHSTDPIVLDAKTHLINTAGWAPQKSWGIYRTEDGGATWGRVSDLGCSGRALTATDGTIYWGLCYGNGIAKSGDQGKHWQKLTGPAKSCPIELKPGQIAALGGQQIFASQDGGQTWEKLADPLPFKPNGIAYNARSRSLYAWRSTEKKVADAIFRWDLPKP